MANYYILLIYFILLIISVCFISIKITSVHISLFFLCFFFLISNIPTYILFLGTKFKRVSFLKIIKKNNILHSIWIFDKFVENPNRSN